jgi:hypothetical protein
LRRIAPGLLAGQEPINHRLACAVLRDLLLQQIDASPENSNVSVRILGTPNPPTELLAWEQLLTHLMNPKMSGNLSGLIFVRAKLAAAVEALAGLGKSHEKIGYAYKSLVRLDPNDFDDEKMGSDFEALRTSMRVAIDQHVLGASNALNESVCAGFAEQIFELTLRVNRT